MLPASMRSAAFRFALLLAGIVAVGAAALLLTVERQVGGYAREASDGMLRTESSVLAGEYASLGVPGLTAAIARRGRGEPDAPYRYLLADRSGRRLAGDLPREAATLGTGTIQIVERDEVGAPRERLATLGTRLPGGLLLVVATDSFDVQDLRDRLGRFTVWSGLGIALFALLGGFVVGRVFLRRLAHVNRAIDRIVAGDRGERLPMIGFAPEFDTLALNLNRMLDRNAAAMDALRQVSTDIAHDLRTPLSRVRQRLERMQRDGRAPEDVDAALAETDALLGVFQALLRIGTMEGGVGRQRLAPVDLTEIMDRVHAAYQPVAEDAGDRLIAEHEAGVTIMGDAELLAQLFTNLIENAIVHTPPCTEITSRLRIDGAAVIADIHDNGPGIPSEEREKVFQRFYRLDASRNTDGSGLGLALVAAIASLHGAECTIPEVGSGLCVRVTFLPTASAPPQNAKRNPAS